MGPTTSKPPSLPQKIPDPRFEVAPQNDDAVSPFRIVPRWNRPTFPEVLGLQLVIAISAVSLGTQRWWMAPSALVVASTARFLWRHSRRRSMGSDGRTSDRRRLRRNPVEVLAPELETGQIASRGGDTIGLACDGLHWVSLVHIAPLELRSPSWVLDVVRAVERSAVEPRRAQVIVQVRTLPDGLIANPISQWPKEAEMLGGQIQNNACLLALVTPQRGRFGHRTLEGAVWLRNEIRQTMTPLAAELAEVGLTATMLNELQVRSAIHRLSMGPDIVLPAGGDPTTRPILGQHTENGRSWVFLDRHHITFEIIDGEETAIAAFVEETASYPIPGLTIGFTRLASDQVAELGPRGPITTAVVAVTHLSESGVERAAGWVTSVLEQLGIEFRRLDRAHGAGLASVLPGGPDLPPRVRLLPKHVAGKRS